VIERGSSRRDGAVERAIEGREGGAAGLFESEGACREAKRSNPGQSFDDEGRHGGP
jgi:hypothetical protein